MSIAAVTMALGMALLIVILWGLNTRPAAKSMVLSVTAIAIYFYPLVPEIAGIASILALTITLMNNQVKTLLAHR